MELVTHGSVDLITFGKPSGGMTETDVLDAVWLEHPQCPGLQSRHKLLVSIDHISPEVVKSQRHVANYAVVQLSATAKPPFCG